MCVLHTVYTHSLHRIHFTHTDNHSRARTHTRTHIHMKISFNFSISSFHPFSFPCYTCINAICNIFAFITQFFLLVFAWLNALEFFDHRRWIEIRNWCNLNGLWSSDGKVTVYNDWVRLLCQHIVPYSI